MFIKRKQFLLSGLCFIGSWIIGSILNVFLLIPHIPAIMSWLLPPGYLRYRDPLPQMGFIIGVLAAFKGNFTAAGFVVVLRYVKQWYLKEQRNLQLQKENTESQLQLLTARVHPRFLFNTLNNIYSKIQTESPEGSKMIMQLSDMLRYILNEGSKTLVPLEKELTMIQDYLNLEKIRYGNQLELSVSLPENADNLQIAPLLILPFVENSFKHGASRFLKAPWINLKIEINGRTLSMKLMNGKDPELQNIKSGSGIGIANVKKRLELLYAGNYELNITDEPEVYTTDLRIELSRLRFNAEVKEVTTDLAVSMG
jgi:LytS/YehU family sensor histidine kinase